MTLEHTRFRNRASTQQHDWTQQWSQLWIREPRWCGGSGRACECSLAFAHVCVSVSVSVSQCAHESCSSRRRTLTTAVNLLVPVVRFDSSHRSPAFLVSSEKWGSSSTPFFIPYLRPFVLPSEYWSAADLWNLSVPQTQPAFKYTGDPVTLTSRVATAAVE